MLITSTKRDTPCSFFPEKKAEGYAVCCANILEVSVSVLSEGLQDDGDHGHQGFHHTELESRLKDGSER